MELTVGIILGALFFIGISWSAWIIYSQKKHINVLEAHIEELDGSRNFDLLGKGKFSELGLMSAGIAHEISNPLTIILGQVTQLQRFYRDVSREKDVAKGLFQIKSATERIGKIIQNLRHYIYRDDLQEEDDIPLSEIISSVLMFCGQRLKNHGIEFHTFNTENIYLRGFRSQFEQAILNLINNSFDAVDSLNEKWIEISAVQHGDMVDIYFKDSGHGIPSDIKAHMFTPFYTTKMHRGTGLGLPLVKGIAEKHSGDFTYVEKAPNTTFLLELPKGLSIH